MLKLETKGQLISDADWRAIDSPKKWMDEFVLFAFLLFKANKSNSSIRFLGESTAHQSAFWFYLTFSWLASKNVIYVLTYVPMITYFICIYEAFTEKMNTYWSATFTDIKMRNDKCPQHICFICKYSNM